MGIDLFWSRSFSFHDLLTDAALRKEYDGMPGIYIHTDHRTKRVAYVGKASGHPGLWNRNYAHYVNLIGGLYLIPELNPDADPKSYVWDPAFESKRIDTVLSQASFKTIVDHAYAYACKVRLRFCALKSHDEAKIAERELLYALQPLDTTRGTKTAPNVSTVLMNHCQDFPELPALMSEDLRKERPNITFLVK